MSERDVIRLRGELAELSTKYVELQEAESACREAEAVLAENHDFIKSVLDSTNNAIFTVDLGGRFLYCNQAGAKMSGYAREELMGAHFFQLLPPEAYEEVAGYFEEIIQNPGHHRQMETTMLTKDGRERNMAFSLTPLLEDGRVASVVGAAEDVTERKELEARLIEAATSDFLTGLANRRQFVALTEREISRSKRYGLPLTLIALDLDHFKTINDTFGHVAGDRALKRLAAALKGEVRDHDVVGRLGGDEFGVAVVQAEPARVRSIAERIRAAVAAPPLSARGARDPQFSVSLGLARLLPEDRDFNDLFRRADKALHRAKERGRDRVEVAG